MSTNSRRRITNLVIDRGALLRTSLPFLALAAISVVTVLVIRWKVMNALERTELVGVENLAAMNMLHDLQGTVTAIGATGLAMIALSCLAHWIFLSHRIFGPMVPMRRHVQKLIAGDYTSRLKVRTSDEFQDLVHDLNDLAEKLAGSKPEPKTARAP